MSTRCRHHVVQQDQRFGRVQPRRPGADDRDTQLRVEAHRCNRRRGRSELDMSDMISRQVEKVTKLVTAVPRQAMRPLGSQVALALDDRVS